MEPTFPLLELVRLRIGIDGKGVTTLVAGAGCPLSCRWCINKRLLAEKQPEPVTTEELYQKTKRDALYYEATGGGLCFGGGEALLHTDFIAAFRELTGGRWRLTAETSLNVSPKAAEAAVACVDDFIVDIKTLDAEIYRRYTGADNKCVLDNLRLLARRVPPEHVRLRIPLIPDFNTQEDQQRSVALLREMGFSDFDLFVYRKEPLQKKI